MEIPSAVDDFLRDLRHAWRLLLGSPGASLVAVLSLALGIGANITIFTFVKAVLMQSLPVAMPAELVEVFTTDTIYPGLLESSYPNFLDLRAGRTVFSGLAAILPSPLSLSASGEPERLNGEIVSAAYFAVLGVRPALGRTFLPQEDELGKHPVAVLSHAFWRRKFAADPRVLGRVLVVNRHAFTVVGVAAPGFTGINPFASRDLWVPLGMRRELVQPPLDAWFDRRGALMLEVVARLRSGVSHAQAAAAMQAVARNLEREYPKENRGRGIALEPLTAVNPNVRKQVSLIAAFLMSMVGLVLALACANVANLLLSRALARRREIAVRMAIGAGRSRLVRQLATESALLALLGGAAGLLLALAGRRLLWAVRPPTWPDSVDVSFDPRVLGFALAITLVTGLLSGLAPALQTLRTELVPNLKKQEAAARQRTQWRLRDLLIVAQIALSLLLLVGTGLVVRSLRRAQRIDPGFAAGQLLVVSFDLGAAGYDEPRGLAFCRRTAERAGALPGVRSASVAINRPLALGRGGRFFLAGRQVPPPQDGAVMRMNAVDERYFATLGIRLLRGRAFTPADGPDAPLVAVINETLAKRFLPGENPVGQHLRFIGSRDSAEIVGVARDAKYGSLGEDPESYVYFPLAQNFGGETTLFVRAERRPQGLLASVRSAVQALDPALPLVKLRTVSDVLAQSLWATRSGAVMLAFFGLLGLVLAAVGTYGVTSYAVSQRRHEIGIRMAMGGLRRDIMARILAQGLVPAAAGLALGLAAAWACSRLIAGFLYDVSALDPVTFIAAPLALGATAAAATLLPARRATRVDPIEVLRAE